MKLKDALNSLEEMKFVDDKTEIHIIVGKGKSFKKDDQIFETYLPVKQAKHFFGELDITLNQIRPKGELRTPIFWFLLGYEENETHPKGGQI